MQVTWETQRMEQTDTEHQYEIKAFIDKEPPKVKKVTKSSYMVISPQGHHYSVKADELAFFKHIHGFDDTWKIQ